MTQIAEEPKVDMYANFDLKRNKILQQRWETLDTFPDSPVSGLVFFKEDENRFYGYNGADWVGLSGRGVIDLADFGVKYGSGLTPAQWTANTQAFNRAIQAQVPLLNSGIVEVNGTLTADNIPLFLMGCGQGSVIRGMADTDVLVINHEQGTKDFVLQNFSLEANSRFVSGRAITYRGYPTHDSAERIYQKPFGSISNIVIKGKDNWQAGFTGWECEFKGGILLITPNRMIIRDVSIQGRSGRSKTDNTTGIELRAPRASVETILDNVQVADMQTGLLSPRSSGIRGLEGLHLRNCTWVGLWDCIILEGNANYAAPGIYITTNHGACRHMNIQVTDYVQSTITGLWYNLGNNGTDPSDYAAFMLFTRCSDWTITHNKCYYQPEVASPANKPYGILVDGGSTPSTFSVAHFIMGNYFALPPNENRPAIWLRNFVVNCDVLYNKREGGAVTVISNLPYNNISNNFPKDLLDGHAVAIKEGQLDGNGAAIADPGAMLKLVTANTPGDGYKLDVYSLRGRMVVIQAGSIDGGKIKELMMYYGQRVLVRVDGDITFVHSNTLRLHGARDARIKSGEYIEFYYGDAVVEVNRTVFDDGIYVATLQPVNPAQPTGDQYLDLTGSHTARYIIVPSTETGKTIAEIRMNVAQEAHIQFDAAVTIKHNLNQIRLAGNTNYTTQTADVLSFFRTTQRAEEVSRRGVPGGGGTPVVQGPPKFSFALLFSADGLNRTVDPSAVQHVAVQNTGTPAMVITLDSTKAVVGQPVIIKRYDEGSTGPVTIQANNSSLIQSATGPFVASLTLPLWSAGGSVILSYTGGNNWELVHLSTSGNGGSGPVNTDALAEGTANLYHTGARVRGVALTGFATAGTRELITATDTVLGALQKANKWFTDLGNLDTDYVTIVDNEDAL